MVNQQLTTVINDSWLVNQIYVFLGTEYKLLDMDYMITVYIYYLLYNIVPWFIMLQHDHFDQHYVKANSW